MKNKLMIALSVIFVFILVFSSCNNSGGGIISNDYFSINLPAGWEEIDESQFENVSRQMERQPGIKFTSIRFFSLHLL